MRGHSVLVRFADGRSVDGGSLREKLSADIFQRPAHYDLAEAFALAMGASPDVEPVLHNLLAVKSSLLRDLSAALFVVESDAKAVAELVVAPQIKPVLSGFAPQISIGEHAGLNAELISRRTALTTVAKAIAHRLFRMRRKPYIAGKAVVRAWVDVTLKMYAREVEKAQIRVFPFPLNRSRQKNFLDELTQQRIDWTRDGLPYPVASIIRLIVSGPSTRAIAIAEFERAAFAGFASEIARSGADPVYTSDEFEVGAVAAGQEFRDAGIEYVNSAHGVGFYCPRTAYSQFRYLTVSQRDFYRRISPQTVFTRRETSNFVLARNASDTGKSSVIFVHQDFRSAGLPAEARVEQEIISRLDAMKLPGHVSKYVKIHPNADPRVVAESLTDTRVAAAWNDIDAGRRLFVLINSTAFYDLSGSGEIAIFKDVSFAPEIYLEGEYRHFDLESLAPMVEAWVNSHEAVRRGDESST